MNLDDDAVAAWVPALGAPVRSQLPPERHLWRVNRFGARGLLGLSVVGLTWSERDGSLVSVPFSEVEAVELVGPNGVVLHVRGLAATRHTFPDVRDRETFQALLLADRQTASLVAGAPRTTPVAHAPAVERIVPTARTTSRLAPALAPVPVPVAVAVPVAVPVATAAPTAAPTALLAAPLLEVPARRTSRLGPPSPGQQHPPSSTRLRAAQLAQQAGQAGQAGQVGQSGQVGGAYGDRPAAPRRDRPAPADRPAPTDRHTRRERPAPGDVLTAGEAFERVRDLVLGALFLGVVGFLVLVVSSQSAQQSLRSTGTLVLTYVGFGLIAAGALAVLAALGRFFLLAGSPARR